ncbi:hypothetical protein Pan97_10670 [Bremerella volcania]|uniref:HNH nuclease domain-containing protein n=1 Tax=Bremerella volcania TaxID=2527984 RepID=A0A518C4A3_9BACT|nr:hypothetical protein [Bremerella volcania]QDU74063.1 hypothetical protein Pan97_10670 [Bremerella volcania]
MRYIDPTQIELNLPSDWFDVVSKAVEYVDEKVSEAKQDCLAKKLTPVESEKVIRTARSKAINAKSQVWSDVGKHLRKISNDKCWYCEADQSRSDMPVDHFRPKNSVVECGGKHPGYWWLAFEWSNYRLACTFCNSRRVFSDSEGGKHDHFPLLDEGKRAYKKGGEIDESPTLLDPCDVDDVDCLTYIDTGQAWEKELDESTDEFKRANTSIKLYHLNHPKTIRERKLIAIETRDRVQRIAEILETKKGDRTQQQTKDLKRLTAELISFIRHTQAFCSAARVYLSNYRKLPFVDSILQKA